MQLVRYFLEKWGMPRAAGRTIRVPKIIRIDAMPIKRQVFVMLNVLL
jgi:hypothetical protein